MISGGVGGRDIVIGSRPYHRQGDDVNLRNLNIHNAYEQEDHLPDDPNYDKLIERKKIVARYGILNLRFQCCDIALFLTCRGLIEYFEFTLVQVKYDCRRSSPC